MTVIAWEEVINSMTSVQIDGATFFYNAVTDGVTDQASGIATAIGLLGPSGGTIKLPAGDILCNDLYVPNYVTLQGAASNGLASVRGGTRLLASIGHSIVKIEGVSEYGSGRVYYQRFKDLTFYGSGDTTDIIYAKFATYLVFDRCSFGNTLGSWFHSFDCYDSRFDDCQFTFGGSVDGSIPGILLESISNAEATNEIFFTRCRWESFFGTAIGTKGHNTFSIIIDDFKFESNLSQQPYLNLFNAKNIDIVTGIMTAAAASGTLSSFIKLSGGCEYVNIDTMFQVNPGQSVTQYIDSAGTLGLDIKLRLGLGCPAPTSGVIIKWDRAAPDRFRVNVQTSLSTPVYDYYYGAQLAPAPDNAYTTYYSASDILTVSLVSKLSTFVLNAALSLTKATLILPPDSRPGQTITIVTTTPISSLVLSHTKTNSTVASKIVGAPTSLPINGFFTLRYLGGIWYRIS